MSNGHRGIKMDAMQRRDLFAHSRSGLGVLCVMSAFLFPFYESASRDALQQMFALAMLPIAAVLFGLSAIPLAATCVLAATVTLMALAPSAYWGGHIASIAALLLLTVACHLGANLQRHSARLQWLLVAISAAAVINAAEGLLQWFGLASNLWPWVIEPEARGRAFGVFRQPNLFATFLSIGVICTIWLVQLRRVSEAMAWFLLLGITYALTASGSRVGVLELGSLAAAGMVWSRQQRAVITRLMVGPLVMAGLATLTLPFAAKWHGFGFSSALNRAANAGQDLRLVLWSNVLDLIRDRPWTGWGWQEIAYGHYVTIFEHRSSEMVGNAHNLPLQIAVEFGVPVALAFFGLLGWGVCVGKPWRIDGAEEREGVVFESGRQFAWAMLLSVGIHSMLEFPLWYAGFLFLTGIAAGYLLPLGAIAKYSVNYRVWSPRIASVGAVLLIALSVVAWQQFAKVVLVSKTPFNVRQAKVDALAYATDAWLFRGYLDFVELGLIEVTPENASDVRIRAEKLLHLSAEPAVIRPLLLSLWYLGDTEAWRFHAERFCRAFPSTYQRWAKDNNTHPMFLEARGLSEPCRRLLDE